MVDQRTRGATTVLGHPSVVLDELSVLLGGGRELDLDGLPVAMIHDSGQAKGRTARMARRFPHARLVVFGHSHIPLDETGDGVRVFNPGSPTDRRRQPHGTIGLLDVEAGELVSARIVPVTD
ncbi:metallophosphoesterase family protein [Actinosynnema sp. CA-248983]